MQQKNLIIFLVCAILLFIGYTQLLKVFSPQPDKKQASTTTKKQGDDGDKGKRRASRSDKSEGRPVRRHPVVEGIPLGDESSKLRVVLDPWGAGVRQIIFNQFQQADQDGKPVTEDGRPMPLEFVMEEWNLEQPSNVLYHFDLDNPAADRPLSTLGQTKWQVVESKETEPGKWKVAFAVNVRDVRITKTFTLGKDDYHIGLEVKVESRPEPLPEHAAAVVFAPGGGLPSVLAAYGRLAKSPRTKEFRYQLAGTHGLRLEGEWYTAIHRNALILKVDDSGQGVVRSTEELRRLSQHEGGDEVLKTDDKFIRYAGVMTQFFFSGVVVDNKQVGGVGQAFLARARPTLERAWVHGKIEKIAKDGRSFKLDTTPERGFFDFFSGPKKQEPETIMFGPRLQVPFGLKEGSRVAVNCTFDELDRKVAIELLGQAQANRLMFDDITVRVATEPLKLDNGPVVHKYLLYNGPAKVMLLGQLAGDKAVPEETVTRYEKDLRLDTVTDYQSNSFFGTIASTIYWTALLVKCTNLMHWVLWQIHKVIPSYGLCILLLTLLVRALMMPLSRKQQLAGLAMQEKMAKMKPELDQLKERYKDDPAMMKQKQTELMLKYRINPFGTCWVVFLQMPIFMGLYYALQESIHFRLAPFWPLWIENLAAPDMLFYWSQSIPIISSPDNYNGFFSFLYLGPFFNLLPVIAVAFMMIQQQLMMTPPTDEQQATQQKMMKYMMILFGLFFYKVAAGLCLYFITSSLWGFTERLLLPKKKKPGAAEEPVEEKKGGFFGWALDKIQAAGAIQSQNAANRLPTPGGNGPTTPTPTEDSRVMTTPDASGLSSRERRKQRRNQRKQAAGDGVPSPPQANNSAPAKAGWWNGVREGGNGALKKLRLWWTKLLKEARKK
jgi:YidC/Oxa1 family membrane protein insertase